MRTQTNDTQATTHHHGHHHVPVVTPSQPTKIDNEAAHVNGGIDQLKDRMLGLLSDDENAVQAAKKAPQSEAMDNFIHVMNVAAGKVLKVINALDNLGNLANAIAAKADATSPFDFDDSLTFTFRDSIFALAIAIENLVSMQPQLIAGEMAISTEVVSPQVTKWSNAFLIILQADEAAIAALGTKPDPGTLATLQGAMSVANANASSSSTALNGVLSMLTSGTQSKTTTMQNLIQQMQSIVTALLNAMTQDIT